MNFYLFPDQKRRSILRPVQAILAPSRALPLLLAGVLWTVTSDGAPEKHGTVFLETVKVPGGYAVGKYEVTQAQYEAVMGTNPSSFKGPHKPVENISWENAMSFCKRLTDVEHKSGQLPADKIYTLPTERQWEAFAAGTSLNDAVTSAKEQRTSTQDVGSLHANKFGLYDVRGNVWEWCLNPDEPGSDARVIRGGGFSNSEPEKLEASYRFALTPLFKVPGIGFRVVVLDQR